MAKVVVPTRSDVGIFTEKDVDIIYEKILLVSESDKKTFGAVKILLDAATRINATPPFGFEYKNYEKGMRSPKDNVFYFCADAVKHSSTRKYTNIVKNWYKHLRNAFAHNYTSKRKRRVCL